MLRPSVVGGLALLPGAVALILAAPPASHGQSSSAGSAAQVRSDDARLEQLAANARRDLAKYRATLGPVLAAYERELDRQKELAAARQDLLERGALSEDEVRAGKRAVAAAQKDVDDTRRALAEADRMMGEAHMADVARARPLPRGQYEETPGLVRFAGLAEWSLAAGGPQLDVFFRSEEHTSEPQALRHLACRLRLEKKKTR